MEPRDERVAFGSDGVTQLRTKDEMATKDIDVSSVDLSAFAPVHKGPVCAVNLALNVLEGEQLEQAQAALQAAHIQHVRIAVRLTDWASLKVTQEAVARHRRHDCSCDQPR